MKPHRSFSFRLVRFLVIGFVLYAVIGFVVAPPLVKSQLEKRLPAELGRPVRIENVRLNPLILSATIEGLAIADPDGGPFVAWDRVYVNFDPTSFFVKEWRFQEITAVGPSGRVVVNPDGSLNFSDLITKFSAQPDDPAAKPAWPLRVARLMVAGAQLDFDDRSRSQPFTTQVGPVNFSLVQFHTSPNRDAPYEFRAETEAGEQLTWRGTVSVNPLASEGELSVKGFQPAKYAPYYRDRVRFDVLGGSLDVSGRYQLAIGDSGLVALLNDGQVNLTGFKMADRGSTAPVLELNDLAVTGLAADVAAMSVKAAKVALIGGRANVKRDQEGVIDLLAMLEPVPATGREATTTTPPAGGTTPKPQAEIDEFSVRQFSATFEDHTTPRPASNTIQNVEIDVQKITLAEGASIPVRAALTLQDRGMVTVAGNVSISPIQATLAVEAFNLSLATISPYIEPMLNVRITQGAVSTKGDARLAMPAGQPMEVSYTGELTVDRFGLVDGVAHGDLAGWTQLAVKGIEFKATPIELAIQEVTWADPKAHVMVNTDGSINLMAALKPAAAQSTEKTPPEAPSIEPAGAAVLPKISIGKVVVNNGAFTFVDHSVQPEVSTAINQFGGTITGLSSENLARADVDLKATVDGGGPIAITGKIDPLGETMAVDLKVDFNDVELTPFSPYVEKFAGFELARGKLFLDVNAKVENEKVDMSNLVTLNQFTFGPPTNSPDATKLPVRLAVALLKDTEGKIVIDLPIQGSLQDPEFRVGKVVMNVIVNILTKAAVSPFSLLGAMFGGGGDELAYQDFGPGEAELTPENLQKLETLTKALAARPELNLEISASFDPTSDANALKERRLAQMIRSRLWDERRAVDPTVPPPEQLVVSPEDELPIVSKLFAEKFPAEAAALLPPAPVVQEPAPAPEKPREKKGFFKRAADIVTLKNWRDGRSDEEEEEAPSPAPAAPETAPMEVEAPAGPPLEEMKSRLAETIEVTTDDLRRLAARRAQLVRDYFVQQQIAGERLFLANVTEEGKGARVFLQLQ